MIGSNFGITAKIGSRGQVTLPKIVRKKLNLKTGTDYVNFKFDSDDSVKVEKLTSNDNTIENFWKREKDIRKKYNLTKNDFESDLDWGKDVGSEKFD